MYWGHGLSMLELVRRDWNQVWRKSWWKSIDPRCLIDDSHVEGVGIWVLPREEKKWPNKTLFCRSNLSCHIVLTYYFDNIWKTLLLMLLLLWMLTRLLWWHAFLDVNKMLWWHARLALGHVTDIPVTYTRSRFMTREAQGSLHPLPPWRRRRLTEQSQRRFWEKAHDANPKCRLQNWSFAHVWAKSSMAMAEPKNKRKVICGGHQT